MFKIYKVYGSVEDVAPTTPKFPIQFQLSLSAHRAPQNSPTILPDPPKVLPQLPKPSQAALCAISYENDENLLFRKNIYFFYEKSQSCWENERFGSKLLDKFIFANLNVHFTGCLEGSCAPSIVLSTKCFNKHEHAYFQGVSNWTKKIATINTEC